MGATLLVLGAIALQAWHFLTPLPPFLKVIFSITQVALLIHAVEGLIAAILILRYRLRSEQPESSESSTEYVSTVLINHLPQNTVLAVAKAGLYVFFVGTVGLLEILKETKRTGKTLS
ncbi:MAG: hypothetical protein AAFY72_00710 [Cyanobacteria bacterium J06649_4]